MFTYNNCTVMEIISKYQAELNCMEFDVYLLLLYGKMENQVHKITSKKSKYSAQINVTVN